MSWDPQDDDDETAKPSSVAAAFNNPTPEDDEEDATSAAKQAVNPTAPAQSYPPASGTNSTDNGTNDDSGWLSTNDDQPQKDVNPAMLPGDSAQGQQPAQTQPVLPKYQGPDPDVWEALAAQRAIDAKPIDRNDPSVKPRVWERILGGLSAGLMGYAHMPNAVEVGQGVTGRRYNAAVADQQTKVRADNEAMQDYRTQQSDANQNFEREMQGYRGEVEENNAQTTAQREKDNATRQLGQVDSTTLEPDDPNNIMGTWHGMNRGGQPVKGLRPPPGDERVKAANEAARREKVVKDNNLTGDEAKYVRINGKLREPAPTTNIHVPSAEADKYNDAKAAWKQAHPGQKLDMKALGEINAAVKGADTGGGGDGQRPAVAQGLVDKAQADIQSLEDSYEFDSQSGKYLNSDKGDMLTPQQFTDRKNQIATKLDKDLTSKKQQPLGLRFDVKDAMPKTAGSQAAQPQASVPAQPPQQPAAPPQQPAQPQAAPAQPPALPPGQGRQLTDKATAKQFLDAAGGDKNKARQLAQKSGWKF